MNKIEEAKIILADLGVPTQQQNERSCLVLLALGNIKQTSAWSEITNEWLSTHKIIEFIGEQYETIYAENTRETIRKDTLHQFRDAAFIEDNGVSTNSPKYSYRLTEEFSALLKSFNSPCWQSHKNSFLKNHETLKQIYSSKKLISKIPIIINGTSYSLSSGQHNILQKAILEEFAPRFAPGSECLYIGDTTKRDLYKNSTILRKLGFAITLHDKMPDVVLYCRDKKWIYFIEAVTSSGPMSPKRIKELETMTAGVKAGKIYVTAFLNIAEFKKHVFELSWETEVWISDSPDHMIHLNGTKFLGPQK